MGEIYYYGIEVAGVEVTSANCNNITGEYITGSVSYNDGTKTLTLDDATIEGYIEFNDKVEDITITLVGKNTINYGIRSVSGTKTINGTGSLKVGYINCYDKTLIEDCTIDIAAAIGDLDWAILGNTLTIKNANLTSEALEVAIGYFADIELIGCEIVKPVNAQIIDTEFDGDYAGKYICDADGNFAKKVVIQKL